MKIDILTLFPEMFAGPFSESIIKRAQEKNLVEIKIHNLRDWAKDKHKTVDDRPYSGGAGMVMMVEPIDLALQELKNQRTQNPKHFDDSNHRIKKQVSKLTNPQSCVILTSAKGETFNQQKAGQIAKVENLIIVCGHYEGVDQRVADHLVDEEISIGNYILSGGEIASMVIVDSIVRLIPGVLGNPNSLNEESFSSPATVYNLPSTNLEYPQYTRPENYKGWKVPEVLLSGNHKEIEKWKVNRKSSGLSGAPKNSNSHTSKTKGRR